MRHCQVIFTDCRKISGKSNFEKSGFGRFCVLPITCALRRVAGFRPAGALDAASQTRLLRIKPCARKSSCSNSRSFFHYLQSAACWKHALPRNAHFYNSSKSYGISNLSFVLFRIEKALHIVQRRGLLRPCPELSMKTCAKAQKPIFSFFAALRCFFRRLSCSSEERRSALVASSPR